MGPLCLCPNSKKPMKKGTRGISGGPLLTPGPWAVPEFPNGQSAPGNQTRCSNLFNHSNHKKGSGHHHHLETHCY
ncbi:unnamed protein product [Staurois parvus]|uniref:Uncharacterized protein n=1 Tax=Staurois parvus TaxID=386267 RepID=A0ABN9CQV8_9NEOB|nr:unnamed protein product [Staurois parvus]